MNMRAAKFEFDGFFDSGYNPAPDSVESATLRNATLGLYKNVFFVYVVYV